MKRKITIKSLLREDVSLPPPFTVSELPHKAKLDQNEAPFDLRVKECYSVEITDLKDISVCGCEPYSYDFFVKNNGLRKGEFALELDGPKWLSLSLEQNFELEPGSNISIGLNIDAPCSGFREYDAMVTANLADNQDTDHHRPAVRATRGEFLRRFFHRGHPRDAPYRETECTQPGGYQQDIRCERQVMPGKSVQRGKPHPDKFQPDSG